MSSRVVEVGGELLSEPAKAAWNAYLSMSVTKQSYYDLMCALDKKYKTGGSCSTPERQSLDELLQAHDAAVVTFSEAMRSVDEPADRQLLLKKMR